LAQKDIHALAKQLEEKRAKFRKNDRLSATLAAAILGAAMAAAIINANVTAQPEKFVGIGICTAVIAVLTPFAYRAWRTANKHRMPTSERCLFFAYKTHTHLTNYVNEGLESDKEKAIDYFTKLVIALAARWDIGEKQKLKNLEDFDFIINPVVKLVILLDNSYYPIILKADQHEIEKIKDYFMTLAKFFMTPKEEELGNLFASAPAPPKEEPPALNPKIGKIDKIKVIIFTAAVAASLVAFGSIWYFTGDWFKGLQIGVPLGLGIPGLYAVYRKLA
jgi:hypothetical protein